MDMQYFNMSVRIRNLITWDTSPEMRSTLGRYADSLENASGIKVLIGLFELLLPPKEWMAHATALDCVQHGLMPTQFITPDSSRDEEWFYIFADSIYKKWRSVEGLG